MKVKKIKFIKCFILFISFFTAIISLNADPMLDPGAGSQYYIQQEMGDIDNNSLTVGRDGAVNYSYPMGDISLSYSSNSGWFIGGYSVITRSTKNGVPSYTFDDTFLLDGEELVLIYSDTSHYEYRTKRDSDTKILQVLYLDSQTNKIISMWEVYRPDGSVAYYNECVWAPDRESGKIRGWAISRKRDRGDDNVTYYKYHQSYGELYLYRVINGKRSGSTYGYTTTELAWVNNVGYQKDYNYIYGTEVITGGQILHSVGVYIGTDKDGNTGTHNDKLISKYELEYIKDIADKALVSKITEYGSDGTTPLPPVTFEYYDFKLDFTPEADAVEWTIPGDTDILRALREDNHGHVIHSMADFIDMNADGLPDRVYKDDTNNEIKIWFNNGAGFDSPVIWYTSESGIYMNLRDTGYHVDGVDAWWFQDSDLIDMNGDGFPDWVSTKRNDWDHIYVMLNDGTQLLPEEQWDKPGHWYTLRDGSWRFYSGRGLSYTKSASFTSRTFASTVDLNGDGLPDTVDNWDPNLVVHHNNGSSFDAGVPYPGYPDPPAGVRCTSYGTETGWDMLDINGDGLCDKIFKYTGQYDDKLLVHFNRGFNFIPTGSEKRYTSTDSACIREQDQVGRYFFDDLCDYIDMNNDGKPDRVAKGSYEDSILYVWMNLGDEKFGPMLEIASYTDDISLRSGNCGEDYDYIDINGDGFLDRVSKLYDSDKLKIWFNIQLETEGGPPGVLKKVTDGNGGSTIYKYKAIDKIKNTGCKPYKWVVSEETVSDGFGNDLVTEYEFEEGVYDVREKEFRGFGYVKKTDPTKDYTITKYFTDEYRKGIVHEKEIYNAADELFVEYIFAYKIFNPSDRNLTIPDKIKLIKVEVADTIKYDGDPSECTVTRITNDYFFDSNGFIEKTITTNFGLISPVNGSDIGTDKTQTITTLINKTGERYSIIIWTIGLPQTVEIWGYEGDNGNFVRQSAARNIYSEDDYEINLLRNEQWYHSDPYLAKTMPLSMDNSYWINPVTYEYDQWNNVKRITYPEGVYNGGYYKETIYDDRYHIFPVEITNAKGHKTQIKYDDWMRKKEEIDVDNAISLYFAFDVFGRMTKLWGPKASSTSPNMEIGYIDWTDNTYTTPCFPRGTVQINRASSSKTYSKYRYIDGLARTIQVKSNYDSTQYRAYDAKYEISGNKNVIKKYVAYVSPSGYFTPTPSNQPYTMTETWLDDYTGDGVAEGKIYKFISTDAAEVITKTKLLTTTSIDANGVEKRTIKDGLGHVKELIEPDGAFKYIDDSNPANNIKTLYEYNTGSGDIIKLTDDKGNVIRMEYNILGQKTDYYDPDMGHMIYKYNANSAIKEQKDGNGNVIKYTYDVLGRIIRVDYPDSAGGLKNYEEYVYDSLGGSGPYSAGKLLGVYKYESGSNDFWQRFFYDEYGNVIQNTKTILLNGFTYQKTMKAEYDLLGKATKVIYPDGENVSYEYNEAGYLDEVKGINDYVAYINYTDYGKIRYINYDNKYLTSYNYYDIGTTPSYRLKNILALSADINTEYTYDDMGNVKTIIDNIDNDYSQFFSYDTMYRLQTAVSNYYGANGYIYDDLGNILAKGTSGIFKYQSAKPHAITDDKTYIYKYDAVGNLIQKEKTGTILPGPTPPSPPPFDYEIDYDKNDWGSGFTVTVTITNKTGSDINGWKLTWTFTGNQRITNAWNSTYSQSGNAVTIRNADWNKVIPNNGSVNFGFQATYSGTNADPVDFLLNDTPSGTIPGGVIPPDEVPIDLPKGVLHYGIYGINNVNIHDRVECKTTTGGYFPIGSYGNVEVGVSAKCGHVTGYSAFFRTYCKVYGDVRLRSFSRGQSNVFIGGNLYEYAGVPAEMLPDSITTYNIDLTGASPGYTVEANKSKSINPGKYLDYTVRGFGILKLKTGVYYFNKLEMELNSRLELDESEGPVKIYVKERLKLNGWIKHSLPGYKGTRNFLIGYIGTQDVYFGAIDHDDDFGCTLIAPNAKIIGGQDGNSGDKIFEGMYIAKDVEFHQDSKITNVPFIELAPEIWTYRYDYSNSMIEANKNYTNIMTSSYDIAKIRVRKTESNESTLYFFSEYEEKYIGTTLKEKIKYYFAGGKRIAERSDVKGLSYYFNDHLTSTASVVDDASGTIRSKYNYDPYGKAYLRSGTDLIDYKYNDKEMDETGFYYYGARCYDPEIGRFVTADPFIIGTMSQGLNRYSYCFNSPMNYIDPTGYQGEDPDDEGAYTDNPDYDYETDENGGGYIFDEVTIEGDPYGSDFSGGEVDNTYVDPFPEDINMEAELQGYFDFASMSPGPAGTIFELANAGIDLKNGRYGKVATDAAWAILAFVGVKLIYKGVKWTRKIYRYHKLYKEMMKELKDMSDLVLTVRRTTGRFGDNDLVLGFFRYLDKYLENGGKLWSDLGEDGGLLSKQIREAMDVADNIHFSVEDFNFDNLINFNPKIIDTFPTGFATTWEMWTLKNNPHLLQKTRFYANGEDVTSEVLEILKKY